MKPIRRIAPIVTWVASGLLLLPGAAMAEGMPQLDFNNPLTTSQVIWGTLIFIVLYILLSRVGLPKVADVLEERAGHIARDLESAHAAKARADAGSAEAATATARARAEAQGAINAAVEEAQQAAAAQAASQNEALERQLKEAEAQIAAARSSAMAALRSVATDTANTVVSRLTGSAPDALRLDAAIGTALSARGAG
jgi:F-type H+-transporting ATPase subunit b